ncbi:MAG: N4-gp56 family major capsid protein, partial [Nanoarchaeota archaeon]|nr:N4-gp56 family major capsid protein [Nanoarchaeota archaeon]
MNTQSISALRPQLWEKELYKNVMDNLFFMNKNLMGTSSESVIKVKEDLMKSKGDTLTMGISYKLSGSGVNGDGTLEGNEEAINSYAQTVSIDQKRNAVRTIGKLDLQKACYDIRADAKNKLSIWLQEFLEMQIFLKAGGITTTTLTDVSGAVYSADATWSNSADIIPGADEVAGKGSRYLCAKVGGGGLGAIATTDIMITDLITKAKIKAQLANPKIRPIKINGVNHYVLFLHPWQVADLKLNASSKWYAAQKEAQVRSGQNPIFTGALGIWDNVILHEHEYVP